MRLRLIEREERARGKFDQRVHSISDKKAYILSVEMKKRQISIRVVQKYEFFSFSWNSDSNIII
jgi:hypothetical protein